MDATPGCDTRKTTRSWASKFPAGMVYKGTFVRGLSDHLQPPGWIVTSTPTPQHKSCSVMGNQKSIVPVIVQEAGMVATQVEYHSGSVVRAVGIALGVMVLLVLSGIDCKHYGIFHCLTQARQPEYNGNIRRDSYFAWYVSRGRVRTDIENQAANPMVLQPPPPHQVFVTPMVAPPGYTPSKTLSSSSSDQHLGMSGPEQFARL